MGDKSVLIMPGEVTGAQAQMMSNALGGRRGARGRRSRRRGKRRTATRRSARSNGTRAKSRTRSRSAGRTKLKKGSAAAKRHMARLRAMRRK